MPFVPATELTYGVEIECAIDANCGVRIGGYHSGLSVPALPRSESGSWKAERDGSISAPSGKVPCEFVSPILKGAAGLDNIRATCAQIKAWGGVTNRSCGLHVHVAFPTDSVADIRRLTLLVAQFEEALFAMTGTPERRESSYCRSIKTDRNKAVDWSRISDKYDVAYRGDFNNRYHVLNWAPFVNGTRPTVEFRVFSGSTNPAKICAWVQVCLTLVQMALDGVEAGGWDARIKSLSGFGRTRGEQMARYLCRRCWRSTAHKAKNYGELGHSVFNRTAAEKTIRDLAIRHDERLGLRPAAAPAATSARG